MSREKYIENSVICLAECIKSDYAPLYEAWNEEDTIWGYNYKLPYTFDEYCEKCEIDNNWNAVIIRLEDNKIIGRTEYKEKSH